MSSNNHYVYILFCRNRDNPNKTKYYIGYTNNVLRRIRQHNSEIKGGAKSTRNHCCQYFAIFSNFQNSIQGLQAEWRLKHSTKKRNIYDKIKSFYDYVSTYHTTSSKGDLIENHNITLHLNQESFDKISSMIELESPIINISSDLSHFLETINNID